MPTRFTASLCVEIVVPEQPVAIHHYLRQPQRLVSTLVEPSRIETLGADHYRLKMRPLSFMMLSIQPTVDLKVWATANGTIHLQSVGCEIRGVEYINQRFNLDLQGYLSPEQINGETRLRGKADLKVEVELPMPLSMMPSSLVEATGNGLLKSVLLTIKQRLLHQLLADYRNWVNAQVEQADTHQAPLLPPNAAPST
ncbi:DUF1997 domain-containing protein [Chlorogloea sp. CCALA 695]|uniref:DUF1997 domain-containing protein n=1 Tax=Chlorogloea sp. CCALA 695 TaxID=2107693 RepID=UPI000D049B66|nr:DUF1997 domain-containing protein [Chlorogloea sp. CCALA 695]PSB30365.1 hypothetical protein C7B70_16305 [Chlorogloea sp. CCALA 695]